MRKQLRSTQYNDLPPAPSVDSANDKLAIQKIDGNYYEVSPGDIANSQGAPADMMSTTIYDPSKTGIVNDSRLLGGLLPSYYLDLGNGAFIGLLPQANVVGLVAALAACEKVVNKGANNGYASLDSSGHVPLAQINIPPLLNVINTWNANTNTPTLANGTGTSGDAYITGTAGTTNFGAGGIAFTVGQIVFYNGTIWQLAPSAAVTGVSNVVTALGSQTGAVTINNTSYINPSANRNYVTDTIRDGLNAANAPATGNPFATMADLSNPPIIVRGEFLSPENFSDGRSLGIDGALHSLASYGYSLPEAQALFPLTNSGSAVAFDLTWTMESACVQECLFTQRGNFAEHGMYSHSRYYMINKPLLLTDINATTIYKRPASFTWKGLGTVIVNASGLPMVILDRMPANQTDAPGNSWGSYAWHFEGLRFEGNALNSGTPFSDTDIAIRLGATYGSTFKNCYFYHHSRAVEVYFGLMCAFENCRFEDNAHTGLKLADGSGQWTGATVANSGSNATSVDKCQFRVADQAFTGLSVYGSDGVNVGASTAIFEGAGAPTHHIYWDGRGSSGGTINKTFSANNLHIEQDVLQSSICVVMDGAYMEASLGKNSFIQNLSAGTALFELQTGVALGTAQLNIDRVVNNESQWRCRNVGTGANIWNFDRVKLADQVTLTNPLNWDTTAIGGKTGTIPSAGSFGFLTNNPIGRTF